MIVRIKYNYIKIANCNPIKSLEHDMHCAVYISTPSFNDGKTSTIFVDTLKRNSKKWLIDNLCKNGITPCQIVYYTREQTWDSLE